MLLLYDNITIVTDNLNELTCIIEWLGEDAFNRLLLNKTIKIILIPWEYATFNPNQDNNSINIGLYKLLSENIDLNLENLNDRNEYLHKIIIRNIFQSPSSSISPDTITNIANKLDIVQSSDFCKLLNNNSHQMFTWLFSMKETSDIQEYFDHNFLLTKATNYSSFNSLEINEEIITEIEYDYIKKYLSGDLNNLLYTVREISIASYLDIGHINISDFTPLLMQNMVHDNKSDVISPFFNNILNVHEFPLIHAGIYNKSISAENVLAIRNSKSGVNFRKWLSECSSTNKNPDQLISEYVKSITDQIPKESTKFSVFKLLSLALLGIVDSGSGLVLSIADVFHTKIKNTWSPILFIRDDYGKFLNQTSYDYPSIPIDILFLLNCGLRICSFEYHEDNTKIELFRDTKDNLFNITYGKSKEEISILKSTIHEIIELSPGVEFYFYCPSCNSKNQIKSLGKQTQNIRCGYCKNKIV